ncbi:hypothetical protein [Neobacillus sp. D3-1R]|uniref:hypothetical protein n=1 Tax=Neobacillus sp. D3-1R TaxID=3445778 RepID=UPI003F9EC867
MKLNITLDTKIKLNPLNIRKDKKNYIIEDLVNEEFYEMPEVCVVALERIKEGHALKEIENDLKKRYPTDEVDMISFVQQLLEMQLVLEVDDHRIEQVHHQEGKLGFTWISPKIGELFFNRNMMMGYMFLFMVNIFFLIFDPSLFPHYTDLFIFDSMTINMILWFIIGGVLILAHEYGHILAIRAHGFPTKLGISHRLFFIVLETDLSLAWKLPPKKRYPLYLAGLSFDNLILFLALFTEVLFPNAPSVLLAILKFIVLDVVLRMVYQFCIYIKTDIYYVIENMTGCYNLMESTISYLKNVKNQSIFIKEEKGIILLYGILYILGTVISLSLFVLYYIPQLIVFVLHIFPGMKEPIISFSFWDSFLVIVQMLIALSVLILSWRNKFKGSFSK